MIKLIRSTGIRYLKRLRQVLCQTSITFVLVALLCLSLGIGLAGTYKLSTDLIDKQAGSYAQTVIQNLEETQSMYSQKIVQTLSSIAGVTVSANYHQIAGGIPIPTTYMIELSQQLSQQPNGPKFSIFSDYPFPDRAGGPQDNFQTDALSYLRQNPTETFNRKERIDSRMVFRYAKAIRMKASCVACHNNLSNSPKKDWKVGDVRGVIEVTQPLDSILSVLKENLRQLYTLDV